MSVCVLDSLHCLFAACGMRHALFILGVWPAVCSTRKHRMQLAIGFAFGFVQRIFSFRATHRKHLPHSLEDNAVLCAVAGCATQTKPPQLFIWIQRSRATIATPPQNMKSSLNTAKTHQKKIRIKKPPTHFLMYHFFTRCK